MSKDRCLHSFSFFQTLTEKPHERENSSPTHLERPAWKSPWDPSPHNTLLLIPIASFKTLSFCFCFDSSQFWFSGPRLSVQHDGNESLSSIFCHLLHMLPSSLTTICLCTSSPGSPMSNQEQKVLTYIWLVLMDKNLLKWGVREEKDTFNKAVTLKYWFVRKVTADFCSPMQKYIVTFLLTQQVVLKRNMLLERTLTAA